MPTYVLTPNRREHATQVFRSNLKRLRQQASMTQCDLARESGLSRTRISNLERGTSSATVLDLFTLADALHIAPADLLKESP